MPRTVPWEQLDRLYERAAHLLAAGVTAPGSTASWSAAALVEDAACQVIAVVPGLADEALTRLAGYLILTGEITGTDRWLQPRELVRDWERKHDPDPYRLSAILHGARDFAHERRLAELRAGARRQEQPS